MTLFLRLFRQFREMEASAARAHDDIVMAQAQVEFWRDRAMHAEGEIKTLNERLVEEAHRIADHISMRAGAGRIYSKAEPLPPNYQAQSASIGTGRVMPSAAVRAHAERLQNEFAQMWAKLPGD